MQAALAGGVGLGVMGRPGRAHAQQAAPAQPAVLKLCSQEGRLPGKNLQEKVENVLKFGGCGIEFGGLNMARAKEIKTTLAGTGCGVAALCWGSCSGDLVATDAARRQKGIDALKQVLQAAAEAGSTGVIFVPTFHKQSELPPDEITKILVDILPAIGAYAVQVGSRVLLEPLNKGETFYLNRLEQGADICRKANSPGICMMGDFYHMGKEETDDEAAFVTAGPYLHHVHLASRTRVLPGQDKLKDPNGAERNFVNGFRGLKRIGYQDYCSLECGLADKTDPMVEIPKAFALLKQQWEEAKL